MLIPRLHRIKAGYQYGTSILLIAAVAGICYAASPWIGYRVVAGLLLISVSLVATVFDIMPVLLAAVLSALIWDFLFIPPRFTFQVNSTEDLVTLLMYFAVVMVHAVLTHKMRSIEKQAIIRQEKERTLNLYNTLFNSLSHELRTPIAAIIGASDNLLRPDAALKPHHRHELLTEISKASFRLNDQVNNLLNMSRLESGFIEPTRDWCDISETVYGVVRIIEEEKLPQKITIGIDPDLPLFRLDKGMLEQILYNLVRNACLYTQPGSRIDITATTHADLLALSIEDNGPGFPEDEIAFVFDKFYRLRRAGTGGTGLGLSIVRGFVEAMGGQVSLKNRTGGGARFDISIPGELSYLKNLKNE